MASGSEATLSPDPEAVASTAGGRRARALGCEDRPVRILTSKATYRRWVYLVLGGAISVPYILFAAVAVPSLLPFVTTLERAALVGGLLTLAVLGGTAFLPAVHVLESTAVRELLDDPVPDAPAKPHTRPGRRRAAAMFVLHVVAGCAVSFFSLAAPVAIGLSVSAVFTGHLFQTGEGDQSAGRPPSGS